MTESQSQTMRTDLIHPGSGRRKTAPMPKGRQITPESLEEVQAALANQPRHRDLLIEHLHRLQDRFGCLTGRHLAALADEMKLSLAEVYETATFYAHFDVVPDGEPIPGRVTIRVCDSLSCMLANAHKLQQDIETLTASQNSSVRVLPAPCMGRCDRAPVVAVGQNHIERATASTVALAAQQHLTEPPSVSGVRYEDYVARGGYQLLRGLLDEEQDFDAIVKLVEQAGLRGLGGAGFPSGKKWSMVRQQPKPRLMAINADEGEPGTFKDRHYLETDCHRFLEGMLIAARVVEATDIYIYLRDEYPQIHRLLLKEIDRIEKVGLTKASKIHLRRGAGAYICGEESAMLESLEGKRGYPRHKPPFPVQVGLFGKPTLIHNVETVYWLRDIIERGPEWFARDGRNGRKGTRSFSVSGRVREPGVKLAPAGITAQELIDEYCGGMQDGHVFRAYLPGGASGGVLPASMANIPLDFGTLEPYGCFIGSAAVIILSDQDDLKAVAMNLMKFFEDESCGQCTPCRVGTEKMVQLMSRPTDQWDRPLMTELSEVMRQASICGLGQAAPNPLLCLFKYFPEVL